MKKILSLLFVLMVSIYTIAQTLSVKAPSSISAGSTFQVEFEVEGKASDFKGPSFKGFSVRGGPNPFFSSSITRVNGKTTSRVTTSFNYIIQADQEGSFTIGPASCVVDGKRIQSNSVAIKVTKAEPRSQQQQRGGAGYYGGGQRQEQQPQATTIDNNSLFAAASVSNSHPYKGEEVIVTYRIYTQVSLQQYQIDKLPGNRGFWSEDLSEGKQVRITQESRNGRNYQVAEIRRGALFAQETGKLTIAPLDLQVLAVVPVQRRRTGTIWDLFDDPFFNQSQAVKKDLRSNAITVNVRPLPEAPDNFYGGVGQFKAKAEVDNTEIKANEAITYRLTVSGHGNLSLLDAPDIQFPQVFEVYEPKVSDNITRGDNGISGSRTFEWVLIPQTQGEYTIPSVDYVYFNPHSGEYETSRTQSINIKVAKGDGSSRAVSTSKSDVKQLNSDINHIYSRLGHLRRLGSSNRVLPVQWLLLALIAGITCAIIVLGRHKQALDSDIQGSKMRHAMKLAQKRLRNAQQFLKDGNDNRFYEEIYKALWGCLSDKYAIELSQLSRETVRDRLVEKGIPDDKLQLVMQSLDDVDQARFAPGDSSSKKQSIYDRTLQTIASLV